MMGFTWYVRNYVPRAKKLVKKTAVLNQTFLSQLKKELSPLLHFRVGLLEGEKLFGL
jgi:hypothetical protein